MNAQPPPPASSLRIVRWFGYFCLLAGAAMTAFGVYFVQLADASADWPSVQGQIDAVRVRVHTLHGGRNSVRTEADRMYYPEVTYSYSVDGAGYTSTRYALGESQDWHNHREQAVEAAKAFQAGQPIAVYYDPADAASAVLAPGGTGGSWVPLLLGIFFLGTGLLMMFVKPQPQGAQ
ncbi:MAG: DUF3592 domain-containing protein [Acidobacteria bacterium]|nr:DUF3592 domain-containing protein [Acidobacteriota bacterium]